MKYDIPLFDLNFNRREERAVIRTLRSRWISTGPKVKEFEELFASMLGIEHAVALSNCTTALHLALLAAGIGPGDEVIVPSLTFVATVNAIRYVGAIPVFCDIVSAADLTIDPAQVEQLITPATRAVIPMHFAGFAADMEALSAIAERSGLVLIEDACHGPLSEYHGRKLGTFGQSGCFSFFSNKNISTGEGGMLVTGSGKVAEKVRNLRSHGMTTLSFDRAAGHATGYDVTDLGYNYRLDDIRAAIGIVQLRKLPRDLMSRKQIREEYLERLSGIGELVVPFRERREFSSNYIMPVVIGPGHPGKRDSVREFLHMRGIQTSIHYPPVHRFSVYRDHAKPLPVTEYVADNEITLPMFSGLKKKQIAYICDSIEEAMVCQRS
jgi:dTDP-4-amino-4,6-dideoxygalactose transaminase